MPFQYDRRHFYRHSVSKRPRNVSLRFEQVMTKDLSLLIFRGNTAGNFEITIQFLSALKISIAQRQSLGLLNTKIIGSFFPSFFVRLKPNILKSFHALCLGLFSSGWMPMEYSRVKNMLDTPSLETMTKSALKIVSKNQNGFFLMVRIKMYRNVLLSIVDK